MLIRLGLPVLLILLPFLVTAIPTAADSNDIQPSIRDQIIGDWPEDVIQYIEKVITQSRAPKQPKRKPSTDTKFNNWLEFVKKDQIMVPYPKDTDKDTYFLTNQKFPEELSSMEILCFDRALAFSHVACNRACDRPVDLFFNVCDAHGFPNGIPAVGMYHLCCSERLIVEK